MSLVLVYVTAGSHEEAMTIARRVVADRLAACANVLPRITSLYWWEGKLEEAQETSIVLKTREDLVKRLTEEIRSIHSASCPCVVSLPLVGGNREFLDWIQRETA